VKIDSYLRPEAFLGDLGLDENLMFLGKVSILLSNQDGGYCIAVIRYDQQKPTEDFQLSWINCAEFWFWQKPGIYQNLNTEPI